MKNYALTFLFFIILLSSCSNNDKASKEPTAEVLNENLSSFKEIGSLTIGGTGAAEITAYDEVSKRLVNCKH
jgi:hypothetical protein